MRPLHITPEDRILIVAPHPDDESIGCGGLIALYGGQCDVLLLTDGRMGHAQSDPVSEDELVGIREREFREAVEGRVRRVSLLRIPDGLLREYGNRCHGYDIKGYTLIFVPNRSEWHPDHHAVHAIFRGMKRRQGSRAHIYEYEVWSPLRDPDVVLDVTSAMQDKLDMVSKYVSQLQCKDYMRLVIGLGQYRGASYRLEYAEAFRSDEGNGWMALIRGIYRLLPYGLRRFIHDWRNRTCTSARG